MVDLDPKKRIEKLETKTLEILDALCEAENILTKLRKLISDVQQEAIELRIIMHKPKNP